MIAIFEIIIFLTRIVFVFVVVRRPSCPSSSSSSVRPPSRPSVRRRRPSSSSSARTSVPSVRRRRLPANPRLHANFRKTHQNKGPTALGASNSQSTRKMMQDSWFKIEKGIRKVCFTTRTPSIQNFGPNDNGNFSEDTYIYIYILYI